MNKKNFYVLRFDLMGNFDLSKELTGIKLNTKDKFEIRLDLKNIHKFIYDEYISNHYAIVYVDPPFNSNSTFEYKLKNSPKINKGFVYDLDNISKIRTKHIIINRIVRQLKIIFMLNSL